MSEDVPLSESMQRLLALEPTLGHSTLAFYQPKGEAAQLIQDIAEFHTYAVLESQRRNQTG